MYIIIYYTYKSAKPLSASCNVQGSNSCLNARPGDLKSHLELQGDGRGRDNKDIAWQTSERHVHADRPYDSLSLPWLQSMLF